MEEYLDESVEDAQVQTVYVDMLPAKTLPDFRAAIAEDGTVYLLSKAEFTDTPAGAAFIEQSVLDRSVVGMDLMSIAERACPTPLDFVKALVFAGVVSSDTMTPARITRAIRRAMPTADRFSN